jgi:hypothetical protein
MNVRPSRNHAHAKVGLELFNSGAIHKAKNDLQHIHGHTYVWVHDAEEVV